MNQRDRAFLQDMSTFMCMNRLATVFALWRTATEPEFITTSTLKYLRFYDGQHANAPQPQLDQLVQNNLGNVQSIMIARVYAELFASYEDLGALGASIRNRNKESKGIFDRYVAMETKHAVSFLHEVMNSNIPNHPEVTLDALLQLPSIIQLHDRLPPDVLVQLESYYQEIPKYLYDVARHYIARRTDVQVTQIEGERPPQWQGDINIILGFPPPKESAEKRSLAADTLGRLKHQFLVTGNLAAYSDPEDIRPIEYVALIKDSDFIDGAIKGVISSAQVMSDFASILLLLDSQGEQL